MNSNLLYEDELVRRFRAGEDDAFTCIYDKFYFTVYQYAKRWLSDKQSAEDVTAEVFIKLLQHRHRMENMLNIVSFMKVAVRNACINILKHEKVKLSKQTTLARVLFSRESEPDFTWLEIREEFLRMIYNEVDKMPKRTREVFLLAYKEGLKSSEIAKILALNVQTVSNHKSNALRILKAALAHQPFLFSFLSLLEKNS